MSGGCNENFVSPDQVLFLRLFSKGAGVFLNQVVAILPSNQSTDRLSSQIKRSRYESILALINLCNEKKYEPIFPPIELCGDNAAMIALVGLEKFKLKQFDKLDFPAKPRWPLDEDAKFLKGAGVKL